MRIAFTDTRTHTHAHARTNTFESKNINYISSNRLVIHIRMMSELAWDMIYNFEINIFNSLWAMNIITARELVR